MARLSGGVPAFARKIIYFNKIKLWDHVETICDAEPYRNYLEYGSILALARTVIGI